MKYHFWVLPMAMMVSPVWGDAPNPQPSPPSHATTQGANVHAEAEKRLNQLSEKYKASAQALAKQVYQAAGGAALGDVQKLEFDATIQDVNLGPQTFHHVYTPKSGDDAVTGPVIRNVPLDDKQRSKLIADQKRLVNLIFIPWSLNDNSTVKAVPSTTPGAPALPRTIRAQVGRPSILQLEASPAGSDEKDMLGVNANSRRILWSYPKNATDMAGRALFWTGDQRIGPLVVTTQLYNATGTSMLKLTNLKADFTGAAASQPTTR